MTPLDKILILFVHIPKTGGTSLETYLSEYYNISLNYQSLFGWRGKGDTSSLQHFTLQTIWNQRKQLGLHEDNLRIFTIVRNPYSRMVSELFYRGMINDFTSKHNVAQTIQNYFGQNHSFDNHKLSQFTFLKNSSENIWQGVEIMHLETIEQDLALKGYENFHYHNREHSRSKSNYTSYLNNKSIQLINEYYSRDFTVFGYEMINPIFDSTTPNANTTQSRLLTTSHRDVYRYNEFRFTVCFSIVGLFLCTSMIVIFKFKS